LIRFREKLTVETRLHNLLKGVVLNELEREGYDLYIEPPKPPTPRLKWNSYRPDILGILSSKTEFRLILVECEVNPRKRSVKLKELKIRSFLTLQKKLNEVCNTRLLLVIPSGKLRAINASAIRKLWNIWIISIDGRVAHKIPKITCN
jgi:hypothetical protein